MIALHMGGIPETAMVLGPVLLIAAFIRIARRHEADLPDDGYDDWDPDLGDLPAGPGEPAGLTEPAGPGEPAGLIEPVEPTERPADVSAGSEPARAEGRRV